MQEGGLVVNDVPIRHLGEVVTCESHSIVVFKHDIVIHLQFKGIFLGFPTQKTTENKMVTCDKMDLIHFTPGVQAWGPYDESYADYKEIFLDFNGYLRNPRQAKKRRLIEEARMDPFRVTG